MAPGMEISVGAGKVSVDLKMVAENCSSLKVVRKPPLVGFAMQTTASLRVSSTTDQIKKGSLLVF
jgi:hypothetical protein